MPMVELLHAAAAAAAAAAANFQSFQFVASYQLESRTKTHAAAPEYGYIYTKYICHSQTIAAYTVYTSLTAVEETTFIILQKIVYIIILEHDNI